MKNNYILDAWLPIVLSLTFGAGLAGVQAALQPRILANRTGDTLSQIPALVPNAVRGEPVQGVRTYKALDAVGATAGWVVPAGGQGFADRIELLIGFDAAGDRITGLYVLDQKETPGLGDNITRADWRGQFTGKPTDIQLVVRKTKPDAAHEIEGWTGATVSSESVTAIVNEAARVLRKNLADGALR